MASDLHLEINEYLPLRDVVFNTLRQAILRGELKPGERLMEIALSQRLGVSRTPVREAIRMLEQEGLVIMIPRKGAQVAEISEKDLKDVLDADLYEKLKDDIDGDRLDLSNSTKWKETGMTGYEPAYLTIVSSGKHLENTVKFIEYLYE